MLAHPRMTKSCASGSTAFTPLDPADCGLYEVEVENLLLSPVRFYEIGARSVSNWSAQRWTPLSLSISCTFNLRALPSRTYRTPSSRLICFGSTDLPL